VLSWNIRGWISKWHAEHIVQAFDFFKMCYWPILQCNRYCQVLVKIKKNQHFSQIRHNQKTAIHIRVHTDPTCLLWPFNMCTFSDLTKFITELCVYYRYYCIPFYYCYCCSILFSLYLHSSKFWFNVLSCHSENHNINWNHLEQSTCSLKNSLKFLPVWPLKILPIASKNMNSSLGSAHQMFGD
jgi:hypothetical protein